MSREQIIADINDLVAQIKAKLDKAQEEHVQKQSGPHCKRCGRSLVSLDLVRPQIYACPAGCHFYLAADKSNWVELVTKDQLDASRKSMQDFLMQLLIATGGNGTYGQIDRQLILDRINQHQTDQECLREGLAAAYAANQDNLHRVWAGLSNSSGTTSTISVEMICAHIAGLHDRVRYLEQTPRGMQNELDQARLVIQQLRKDLASKDKEFCDYIEAEADSRRLEVTKLTERIKYLKELLDGYESNRH